MAVDHVRDSEYYIQDGNTVILVGNTLFNVHRSMLVKDHSTFADMFGSTSNVPVDALDAGNNDAIDGQSDDHPIILHGDDPADFRALMWSLYATAAEYTVSPLLSEGFGEKEFRLCRVARMAHKYQFKTTARWAMLEIRTIARWRTAPMNDIIEIMTELAVLYNDESLLETMERKWKQLIGEGQNLSFALVVTERLNLHKLLGLAYYSILLKGRDFWDSEPILTRSHRIRLLSGHYGLSQACAALPRHPPAYDHSYSCNKHVECQKAWAGSWYHINSLKEDIGLGVQVMKFESTDLMGRMMLAQSVVQALVKKDIPAQEHLDGIHEHCQSNVLQATLNKVKEIQDNLMNWFVDVE